jgi:hypothetical protein
MFQQGNLFTLDQVNQDRDGDYVLAEWNGDQPMYRKVMSEDECQQAAMEDWLDVLSRLWVAYDKPLDPVRLVLYQNMLRKLPTGLLELAIEQTVRVHGKYNNVPTVGEVWEAVRMVLHNPYDLDQAIADWNARKFEACLYRFDVVAVETEEVMA